MPDTTFGNQASSAQTGPYRFVPCPTCHMLNRIPLALAGSAAQDHKSVKCGQCKTGLDLSKPVVAVDGAGLRAAIAASPLPVVVDCWAPWCSPCLAFAPTYELQAATSMMSAVFLKLNTEDDPDAAAALHIRGIPTLVLFSNGKETARISGALPAAQLSGWLASHGVH